MFLFEGDELDFELEGRIGGNNPGEATGAVREVGRAGQLGHLSLGHLGNSLIPSPDDISVANGEGERLAALPGGVKLGAVSQGANIVDIDSLALARSGISVTRSDGLNFNSHFK